MDGNGEDQKQKQKRTKWLHVKATPDELAEWSKLATDAGLTLADLVRSHLSPGSDPVRPKKRASRRTDPVLVAEVGRIGSNLNQLARWANSYKSAADSVQVLAELAAIERDVFSLVSSKKRAGETDDDD